MMEAEIIGEEELETLIPAEGVEICVTSSEVPLILEGGALSSSVSSQEIILSSSNCEPGTSSSSVLLMPDDSTTLPPQNDIEDDVTFLEESPDDDEEECRSPYECHKCGLLVSGKSTFELHVSEVHVDEAYYACEFCPATGIHWSEYYLHQCTNMDSKPLSCPTCEQTVSTKKQLSAHEEIHSLQKRFATKKLDAYFQRKLEEAQDPAIDWGAKGFICGICGKCFGKLYEVEYHEKLHNGQREAPHKCDKCGLPYLNKNDLNKHMVLGCHGPGSKKTVHKPRIVC